MYCKTVYPTFEFNRTLCVCVCVLLHFYYQIVLHSLWCQVMTTFLVFFFIFINNKSNIFCSRIVKNILFLWILCVCLCGWGVGICEWMGFFLCFVCLWMCNVVVLGQERCQGKIGCRVNSIHENSLRVVYGYRGGYVLCHQHKSTIWRFFHFLFNRAIKISSSRILSVNHIFTSNWRHQTLQPYLKMCYLLFVKKKN